MKKSASIMIAVFGAGIMAAQASLVTTTITNTVDAQQGQVRLNGVATKSAWSTATNAPSFTLTTGTLGGGEETTTRLARGILKFDYAKSLLAAGDYVTNATLRLYVTKNNLSATANTWEDLYGVANMTSGIYSTNDFFNPAFSLISTNAGGATTATNFWVTIDVTALVSNAFVNASGATVTTGFRLQLNNDMTQTIGSPQPKIQYLDNADLASVTNGIGYHIPELVISTIPEPATALLFGLGGVGAWLIRRSKTKKAKEDLDT